MKLVTTLHNQQLLLPAMAVRFASEEIKAAIQSSCRTVGVASLKDKQMEAIVSFMEGRNVFVCLPMGYGKSLCFALLPLVFDYLHRQERRSV